MAVPSLALTSLSIRDFRGIRELDLDFRGPDGKPNQLVVLAGPNGCGKTTALEAGILVSGSSSLVEGATAQNAVRRGANNGAVRACHWKQGQVQPEVVMPLPIPEGFETSGTMPIFYSSSSRSATFAGPIDPKVGGPTPRFAGEDRNWLRIVKQQLVNAATIERFQGVAFSERGYSVTIKIINKAWREFYPERNESFAVDIVQSRGSDGGSFDVFLCMDDGVRLEVDLLSSGQLELFLFISTLALSGDREGIVFIDEPELHLDPQWHRLILRSLIKLQPRVQFIVATHSPEIYDEARFYERHFLVPEDDPRARLWPPVKQNRTGD